MSDELTELAALARRAGALIMQIYERGFEASEKADGSAVTEADDAAEALILAGLAELYPNVPVLAEEAAARGEIPDLGRRFLLVDPLDGTREFVNRTGEFTVNIAMVEDGAATMGVVFAPAAGRLFAGARGRGAWAEEGGERRPIETREQPQGGLVAVASRSHRSPETQAFLDDLGVTDFETAPRATYALLGTLPLASVTQALTLLLVSLFLVTSADSGAYVLGLFSRGGEPGVAERLYWGAVLAALTGAAVWSAGGQSVTRAFAVTGAVPLCLLLAAQAATLLRSFGPSGTAGRPRRLTDAEGARATDGAQAARRSAAR